MTEWGVVSVIIALVGLLGGWLGIQEKRNKPMEKMTTEMQRLSISMTELNMSIKASNERYDKSEADNEKEHQELWKKTNAQDEIINKHELRITMLEKESNK